MRTCNKCQCNINEDELIKQIANNKEYIKNICRKCYNSRKNELRKINILSRVKTQYRNCNIKDNNKVYNTNNLNEIEIKELKLNGYSFIFK